MRKTSAAIGIKALTYKNIMEFKNSLLQIFTHPIKAIGAFFNTFGFIFIAFFPTFLNMRNRPSIKPPINIISAVVMLLIIIIFFLNLYKAVDEYYPTQYSNADINFLFTSPLSSRFIYGWSIGKKILRTILTSAIMMVLLFGALRSFKIYISNMGLIFTSIGIFLYIVIIQSLNFFIYSVSKRFNIGYLVEKLVIAAICIVIFYFVVYLYGADNILQRSIDILGGKSFAKIPILGWINNMIMSVFTAKVNLYELLFLIAFVVVMLFITVYLATDYYEEAVCHVEKVMKIKTAASKKDYDGMQSLNGKKNKKQKAVKAVNIDWNLKGAYAFVWKSIVINSRQGNGLSSNIIRYGIFAVIGGAMGYAFRNEGYKEVLSILMIFSISSIGMGSLFEGLKYELQKKYIFLLPGNMKNKILAINTIPILKMLFRNLIIIAASSIFLKITILQLISLWVLLSANNVINLFTIIVIKVLVPSENNKNIILSEIRILLEILAILPAATFAFFIWFLLKKIEVAIFIFGMASILSVIGLLYLSEVLFKRLELSK